LGGIVERIYIATHAPNTLKNSPFTAKVNRIEICVHYSGITACERLIMCIKSAKTEIYAHYSDSALRKQLIMCIKSAKTEIYAHYSDSALRKQLIMCIKSEKIEIYAHYSDSALRKQLIMCIKSAKTEIYTHYSDSALRKCLHFVSTLSSKQKFSLLLFGTFKNWIHMILLCFTFKAKFFYSFLSYEF